MQPSSAGHAPTGTHRVLSALLKRSYSVPLATGVRGAGLGNECISWGKAAIAADVLGLELVDPQWGLNRRGYSRDFGSPRTDWLRVQAMRVLPTVEIDAAKLDATGFRFDYQRAMEALRPHLPAGNYVMHHRGMEGGFTTIRAARPFLRSKLLGKPDQMFAALDSSPSIVIHVRADDFKPSTQGPGPGVWNTRVPMGWYRGVAALIRDVYPDARFTVVTDTRSAEVLELEQWLDAFPAGPAATVLGDLDKMVQADLLVCSVSSFSMLAAFLSDNPYIWFEPNLYNDAGWRSIWGLQIDGVPTPTGAFIDQSNDDTGRGFALRGDEPRLPSGLSEYLGLRRRFRRTATDLIHCGAIRPAPTVL